MRIVYGGVPMGRRLVCIHVCVLQGMWYRPGCGTMFEQLVDFLRMMWCVQCWHMVWRINCAGPYRQMVGMMGHMVMGLRELNVNPRRRHNIRLLIALAWRWAVCAHQAIRAADMNVITGSYCWRRSRYVELDLGLWSCKFEGACS